ncbi:EH domain-containing protein 4 [Grus japonensis]|uniref:EH domain-containing protein 4 n=1 Tax=Grus japonensis TaxID=30415 RepID=A0ABC9VXG0_GRUJA
MEINGGADIHLQPMKDPRLEQMYAPKGGCDTVENPYWSRLLTRPVDPWREEPTPEQVCWQDPMVEPRWSSLFLRDSTLWEGPMLDKFVENCLPWVGPHAEAGDKCDKEGVAKTMCDELAAISIPHPLCRSGAVGREIQE